jgi:hypothetical protein
LKAKEGVLIRSGGGYPDDCWYEEEIVYGKKAKRELNLDAYEAELKRRSEGRK